MRIIFDTEVDALTLEITRESVAQTIDVGEGRLVDVDDDGHIVAIEILDASQGFKLIDLIGRFDLEPVIEALSDHIKTARQVLEDPDLRDVLVG